MLKEGCGQYGNAVRGRLRLKNEEVMSTSRPCGTHPDSHRFRRRCGRCRKLAAFSDWPARGCDDFSYQVGYRKPDPRIYPKPKKKEEAPRRRPPATPSSPTTKTAIPKAWFNDF